MITALRVSRILLILLIVLQILILTDTLVAAMLMGYVNSYMVGGILGKIFAIVIFSILAVKCRKYINALYQSKGNNSLLIEYWYSF